MDNIVLSKKKIWKILLNTNEQMWNENTFENIFEIKNIEDFWIFFGDDEIINKYLNYNFHIMKKNIFPLWENIHNKYGMWHTLKLNFNDETNKGKKIYNNEEINEIIRIIIFLMIQDKIIINYEINGISIKNNNKFIIIKLWFKNNNKIKKNEFHEFIQKLDFFYSPYKN